MAVRRTYLRLAWLNLVCIVKGHDWREDAPRGIYCERCWWWNQPGYGRGDRIGQATHALRMVWAAVKP